MKLEKLFSVYDDNNIRNVLLTPTGDIVLRFALLPQLSVLEQMKMTEELLQIYATYVSKVL